MIRRITTKKSEPSNTFTDIESVFSNTESELAAFVGQTMVMTPGDLIFDANIIDGSIRYWCALRSYFSQSGEVRKPPTQEDMSLMLNINRKTAGTYFNILRATRWITVLKVIKQNNLEMGYSYLLHDTRMKLEVVLKHDKSYIDFLCDNTKAKNKRLRDFCQSAIIHLPDNALVYLTDEQILRREKYIAEIHQDKPLLGKKTLDVQILPSEENADVQNLPSEENSVSKIYPTEKKLDDQNLLTEKNDDIYNTTCAYTPTQIRISEGDKDNTTTTSCNGSRSRGNKPFAFFETSELLSEILWDMEHDQLYFGKSTVHAIKNCLKKKSYESKDGKPFRWICTEDKAIEMLIVLLSDKPDSPLNYLKTLIFADSNDEFLLKPKQRQLLVNYHQRINPDYQIESRPVKANETPLEQFIRWLNTPNDKREFKPMQLCEGQKIKALTDLQQWGITAEAVTELTLPTWITDLSVRRELIASGIAIDEDNIDRVSNLSLHFGDEDKSLDYEAICKAIELGLLTGEVE